MQVLYHLQIVNAKTGDLVRLPGGTALERDLIAVCTQAIVTKGVGLFRTEAHVRQAITDGITEALLALKAETRKVPK